MSTLTENMITFGKYKNKNIEDMLKDRNYCNWLIEQDWFFKNYEYIYNRVKEYSPKKMFVPEIKIDTTTVEKLLETYPYFHLKHTRELGIQLSENEKLCYKYYRELLKNIKDKISENLNENPYNIKAPSAWLNKFEDKYGIQRSFFKDFLQTYDLPNITLVIEDIKKIGGIDYKGNKSFIIAKEKSLKQEKYWENILKNIFSEDIGTQFKFEKCFFDFIHIKKNILFECKLGLKDFNKEQFLKYTLVMKNYNILYLIDNDCIINYKENKLYTINIEKYKLLLSQYNNKYMIFNNLDIIEIQDVQCFLKNEI